MSEQQVTEDSQRCINSAPKSLGQIGYEAMLGKMLRDGNEEEQLFAQHNIWENQCQKLKDDWELVATAIEIAVKEQVVKEVHEQMGAKL